MRESSLKSISAILKEEPLELPIAGDCMVPSLALGEEVEIEGLRRLWPGDVLLFQADDSLVAHRFLGWVTLPKQAGALHAIVKADRAKRPDAPVPLRHCLGRVKTQVGARQRIRAGQDYYRYLALSLKKKITPWLARGIRP